MPMLQGNSTIEVIYQTRETASSGYPNTEKTVKNKTRRAVLKKFEVFK